MIENIKARFKSKRFNIWTEEIDLNNSEGYFIYNGHVYFGNRFGVFFKSSQILFKNIVNETYGKKTFIDLVSDEESQVHEVVRKLKERGNK
jgi:hypothetical protein